MSVHFIEPSTDGAPGIWSLEDALAYQAQGRWPTIPATVPSWLVRGPDGALPSFQAEYALGRGWFNGRPYATLDAFHRAASGTFNRASNGSRIDRNGLMRTAGPNVLRLTHDPATGKALGYLREEQAANLLPDSESFNSWSIIRTNKMPNAAIAPDGAVGAASFVPSTELASHVIYKDISVAAGQYTESVFAKPSGITGIRLNLSGAAIGVPSHADFDLVTGTIVAGSAGWADTARIKRLRDGWYRCSILGTATTGGISRSHVWAFEPIGGLSFVGDGVASLQIWGAQLETGAYPTSYIKTGSGSAIRFEDDLYYDLPGTPEGTVVIEARTPAKTDGNRGLWSWDDGTAANAIFLYRSSAGVLAAVLAVNGVTAAAFNVGAVAADTDIKVALSWRQGQLAASLNGAAAAVSTSYLDPLPVLSKVKIGTRIGISRWASTIASARILPKSYDPADLQGMSAL